MRSIILKILTSISVLVGLLGPHVASGQIVETTNLETAVDFGIPVVDAVYPEQVVTHVYETNYSNCNPSPSLFGRIDLFIWQACGDLVVQDTFILPSVAVVDSIDTTSVVVENDSKGSLTNSTFSPVNVSVVLGIVPVGVSVLLFRANASDLKIGQQKAYIFSVNNINYQNSFTTISMRC